MTKLSNPSAVRAVRNVSQVSTVPKVSKVCKMTAQIRIMLSVRIRTMAECGFA